MREIRFRGKRVDNDQWVEGDLLHGVNHKSGKMFILPVRGGVMALGHGLDPLDGYEVIPSTVGQYTGLKDKNGKDIYEGDIVSYKNPTCKGDIKFGSYSSGEYDNYESGTGFYIDRVDYVERALLSKDASENLEIIGNIFDNPELLTTPQGDK